MKKREKISVIVPVYGTEKYVENCLNSILYQTYNNIEILVVNDGSIDNSEDRIFRVANKNCKTNVHERSIKCIELAINKLGKYTKIILEIESDNIFDEYYHLINNVAQDILIGNAEFLNKKVYKRTERGKFIFVSDTINIDFADHVELDFRKDSYCITGSHCPIRYIRHLENKGLFQARLTGYEYSVGDFIATVDSDDYVGIDYFRLLQKKAAETNADVIISEFVKVISKTGYKGKRTHGLQAVRGLDLKNKDILNNFFLSEGEVSVLWFVCGKLYKRRLWEKCYSDFCRVEGHHIMLEDMMYGLILSTNASHYVWCDADTYFYVANEEASTSTSGGYDKLKKNIDDVLYAFEFLENYLKSKSIYEKYENAFCKIKGKWSRTWYDIEKKYQITPEQRCEIEDMLLRLTLKEKLVNPTERDTYFYDLCTPWDERIEQLKKKICEKEIISFDIFDTLIIRPFYKPSDLFVLLNETWNEIYKKRGAVPFCEMRVKAEKSVRKKIVQSFPQFEEISLDEIYEEFEYLYDISKEVSERMKQKEVEAEIKFCKPRKKIKELYEMARWMGKKVVAISDIYLPKPVIKRILKNCGYDYFDVIYLSCEKRRTKESGGLFEVMLGDCGIDGGGCLHLGDNWNSDCISAQKFGIEAWRTARPMDLLLNKVSDMGKSARRGNFGALLERNSKGNFIRYIHANEYFGIRCMLAVIANKIFDNPYADYEPNTDFNRNPYNVGYMALGMHNFVIVQWLIANCKHTEKIHFVARDGYLAKRIYEIVQIYVKNIPAADYFHMSRKSFLPLSIETKNDWWSICSNINYKGKTPREILGYYIPILECNTENIGTILWEYGIIANKPLENEMQYNTFIKAVQKEFHSEDRINKYRADMKAYFSSLIKQGEVMFDIGYSGRAQAILSKLLGYGIDAFYIHTLSDKALVAASENHFNLYTFYDYTPALTGKIRELVQSEPAPSCIGYEKNDIGEYKPIFENRQWDYHEYYVISQIHKGAIGFVEDFLDTFSGYLEHMTYRQTDASFIHESFVLLPRQKDMEIFKLFHFEDDLFFNKDYATKKLIDVWRGDLKWQNLMEEKANASKNTSSNLAVIKYQPYVERVEPPKGLKKIKYFYKNDHIILQKYMEKKYGNGIRYKLFYSTYQLAKKKHHLKRGLNDAGNRIEDFTLSKNGNILYNATSAYGLLCCMLHKLTFHADESAEIMLSVWRKDKIPAVRDTDIFVNVILWDDLKYRSIDYAMDKVLQNATEVEFLEQEWRFFKEYEKLLPFKISNYKKIIIAGNSMPFGCYLERNQVPYDMIEDGAGIFSNPALLLNFIQNTYPLLEQYMIRKYKIFEGSKYCVNTYINYAAQKGKYSESNTVDFQPVKLVEKLPSWQRRRIFRVFGIKEAHETNRKKTCLLLTYPLAQREKITVEAEKKIYALLADIFANGYEEYHLKAHPDDRTDFSEIEDFKIINRQVLSELLWYETKTEYDIAISVVSTSLNNLLCIRRGVTMDEVFSKEYKNLIKYFCCVKIAESIQYSNKKIFGIGLYDQMMEAIISHATNGELKYEYQIDDNNKFKKLIIIGEESTEEVITDKLEEEILIYINEPSNFIGTKKILIQEIPKKKYSFLSVESQKIYISENVNLQLPIKIPMEVTGIELVVREE